MVAVTGEQNSSGAMRSVRELLPAERFQLSATREFQRRDRVSVLRLLKELNERVQLNVAVLRNLLNRKARKTLSRLLRGPRLLA